MDNGRWLTPDALASQNYSVSPYAYCNNNPVKFIDPDGNNIWDIIVGTATAAVDDMSGGLVNLRNSYHPTDADDYNLAQDGADLAMIGIGTSEVNAGGSIVAGSVDVTLTTGGASIEFTLPTALFGAAVAGSGVMTATTATRRFASQEGRAKVPNPNGKKGGEAHQNKIDQEEKNLKKDGYTQTEREVEVKTPGGEKSKRYIDVKGTNPKTGQTKSVQVGRQNKNGTPVSRERKAINDIKNATGEEPEFSPYNK